MFIQINGKPINAFQLVYWYYKDIKENDTTVYSIFYRITDGRVLREDFESSSLRQSKIDVLLALSISGGDTGVSSYPSLTDKPQINGVELLGNKTSQELGLQPVGDYATKDYVNESIGNINTILSTLTTVSEVS